MLYSFLAFNHSIKQEYMIRLTSTNLASGLSKYHVYVLISFSVELGQPLKLAERLSLSPQMTHQ